MMIQHQLVKKMIKSLFDNIFNVREKKGINHFRKFMGLAKCMKKNHFDWNTLYEKNIYMSYSFLKLVAEHFPKKNAMVAADADADVVVVVVAAGNDVVE